MQNTGTLIHCQWEYINTMVQSLENSLIVPYSKYLPYIPKVPPLGDDPRKYMSLQRLIFISALFIIAPYWK